MTKESCNSGPIDEKPLAINLPALDGDFPKNHSSKFFRTVSNGKNASIIAFVNNFNPVHIFDGQSALSSQYFAIPPIKDFIPIKAVITHPIGFNHLPNVLMIGSKNFPMFNKILLVRVSGPIIADVAVIQAPNLVAI